MSVVEPTPAARPHTHRPFHKRVMHVVRRTHLYLGLFLLPWAVLYGVTAFLFNHPTAFADQPTTSFGRSELAGTPMEHPPAPAEVAAQVVAGLRARQPEAAYTLVEPEKAKYTREFAFATVKAGDQQVSLLFDMTGTGGTVRGTPIVERPAVELAPFAIATRAGGVSPPSRDTGLSLDAPLHERVKAAVPVVLERTGFPTGEVTVTSVPDLSFFMNADGKVWKVTFSALTGSVAGVPADEGKPAELSVRRFLTRLHLASGYPGSPDARWFWAVVVDVMGVVLVFWGVSGLFMWWQIKATRRWGILVVLLSAAAATALGFGMHAVMTGR